MKQFLLPYYYKIIGIVLSLAGLSLTFYRFYLGEKPDFLNFKVFAVSSSYFKTSWFSLISNNISEELCIIIILTGVLLYCLSREKREMEVYNEIRSEAVSLAFFLNFIFILLSTVFIYGLAFIAVLIINIFTPLILYIAIFRIRKLIYLKSQKEVLKLKAESDLK